MTKDKFQKAVDDAITNCIRNDCAFGSYAHKVTKAVWPLLEAAEKERDYAKAAAENIALKLDYLRSKLETAENAQNDWLRANAPGGWIDNLRIENEALRAKHAEMEKQAPVAEWTENRFHHYPQLDWAAGYKAVIGAKLYALPGAQPAPSVPVDILYRLGAAHDACLDGDHRACRDAITQLMCEIGPDGAVPEPRP